MGNVTLDSDFYFRAAHLSMALSRWYYARTRQVLDNWNKGCRSPGSYNYNSSRARHHYEESVSHRETAIVKLREEDAAAQAIEDAKPHPKIGDHVMDIPRDNEGIIIGVGTVGVRDDGESELYISDNNGDEVIVEFSTSRGDKFQEIYSFRELEQEHEGLWTYDGSVNEHLPDEDYDEDEMDEDNE